MIDFENPDLHDNITIHKTFKDMNIEWFYVAALQTIGFVKPTPVQYYSISAGIQQSKQNLIVQSKSGTGKTLAYLSICLQRIFKQGLSPGKQPTVLILEPTRQLAVQVYQNIRKILSSSTNVSLSKQNIRGRQVKSLMSKMNVHLSIGGIPIEDDRKKFLEQGCHISIGTIGRLWELVHNNILNLKNIKTVVLDQGDKLFEQPDSLKKLNHILGKTISPQILVYSATYNNATMDLLKKIAQFRFIRTIATQQQMKVDELENIKNTEKDYEEVDLELNNITKLCTKIQANDKSVFTQKLNVIKDMLSNLSYKKCLIFVEKKAQIPQIFQSLKSFNPLLIHGSLSQSTRIKLMNQMNSYKTIITSDLLARGIDIVVDLIILFNSNEGDNFWHRIGRTGRIGRKGVVISLDYLEGWEEYTKQRAEEALSQCMFVAKKQTFGEYMTEMGNWMDVDQQLQLQNVNNYKYFDEQEFEQQIEANLNMEEQIIDPIQQDLIPGFQEQIINNEQQLYQQIRQALKCQCCLNNIYDVQNMTGYQFQILKIYQNNI